MNVALTQQDEQQLFEVFLITPSITNMLKKTGAGMMMKNNITTTIMNM
jgi:hypothetical protein